MRSYRCYNCMTLLFKGLIITARIEAKCSKCNYMNTWALGDPPRVPVDKAMTAC